LIPIRLPDFFSAAAATVVFIQTQNPIENGIRIPATAEFPDKKSETIFK
jgi:hypothetical protein